MERMDINLQNKFAFVVYCCIICIVVNKHFNFNLTISVYIMQNLNTALTQQQQAQTVAMLTGTYTDRFDLQGIYNAYCNTGILTDMLSDDDRAYFDHEDIDTTADDFDIFGHGELSFSEVLERIKAIGEVEQVIAYALPMHVELEKAGALYIQRIG